jgi:hypothetical protein
MQNILLLLAVVDLLTVVEERADLELTYPDIH